MTAPGVTFESVDLHRPGISRLRTDICGFVGYTERGPVDRAVKVRSWRQFVDAFGPELGFAHLGHAMRLYFENGGDAAHVVRVTDIDVARTATASIDGAATLHASYAAIGRLSSDRTGPTTTPASISSESPGAWGNRLAVLVQAGGLGATQSRPNQSPDGASVHVETIAGFEVGSYVRLIQDGVEAAHYGLIESIDPALNEIVWASPITGLGLDFAVPFRLESVEFSLVITIDGQERSRHHDLSLNPVHSRFLDRALTRESAEVAGTVTMDANLLSSPALWPGVGGPVQFSGGRDGLATVTRQHLLDALKALERIDEVSVLAAPDLVLVAADEPTPLAPILPDNACHVPEALPTGALNGIVLEAGTGDPVVGVRVSSRDAMTRSVLSDAEGKFTLTGLPVGQVGLRLEKAGFFTFDATGQAFEILIATPQRFEVAPRILPPVFTADEIFEVQAAMIGQGARGLYRVALLDPPESMLDIEDLRGWRSRFDSSFAALHWPWLITAPPGTKARAVPPSGAVAGLIARMDREEGPQRAAANRPLRNVVGLTHPVDDAIYGLLNQLGINVLRATPGQGIAPQGARTLSSDPALRYLGVRRLLLMIAESIEESHQWVVFEPNNRILRDALTHSLNAFLRALWQQGAFAGASPEASYAVKCDEENNPPTVIDAGQLVAQIAVAPVRPSEFIHVRLGRTDRLRVQEQE